MFVFQLWKLSILFLCNFNKCSLNVWFTLRSYYFFFFFWATIEHCICIVTCWANWKISQRNGIINKNKWIDSFSKQKNYNFEKWKSQRLANALQALEFDCIFDNEWFEQMINIFFVSFSCNENLVIFWNQELRLSSSYSLRIWFKAAFTR